MFCSKEFVYFLDDSDSEKNDVVLFSRTAFDFRKRQKSHGCNVLCFSLDYVSNSCDEQKCSISTQDIKNLMLR